MLLLLAIEIFLIRFPAPSASVSPASSASVASTALHERRSFGLTCPLYNCLAVFVEDVLSLLMVILVPVVPGGEIILYTTFRFLC